MLSLNQLIYQIYEDLQINSDDTSLDKRLIKDLINHQRAVWIRREHNKNRSIDDNIIQDLGCVELELIEDRFCEGCEDISTDCVILRSKKLIPNGIELNHEKMVTRISGVLGITSIPIIFIDYDQAVYWGNGRYNTKSLGAFIKNNYLYVVYNKGAKNLLLEYVNLQGVFEDPTDVAKFSTCGGTPCFNWDTTKYPINAWMWQALVKPAVLEECKTKRTLYKDEQGNSKDDAIPSVNVNIVPQGSGVPRQQQPEE